MKKAASIYQRPTGYILQADAPMGRAWLAAEPILHLPITASAEELGSALIAVIQPEQMQVTPPPDWKEFNKLNLRRLGMKTTKQLHTDCKFCHLTVEEEVVRIEPSANQKTSFAFFAKQTVILESTQAVALGHAILQALAQST
jgi:hypothetical protein